MRSHGTFSQQCLALRPQYEHSSCLQIKNANQQLLLAGFEVPGGEVGRETSHRQHHLLNFRHSTSATLRVVEATFTQHFYGRITDKALRRRLSFVNRKVLRRVLYPRRTDGFEKKKKKEEKRTLQGQLADLGWS
jgi:hypothetical protein